ncbi:MAG: hypothetical protein HYU46_08885 [Deltaproteobacteria bacterium]|nr:hypothetical protein [Deltaproteobacteria bacterium]
MHKEKVTMAGPFTMKKNLFPVLGLAFFFVYLFGRFSEAAELPLVRIAHGVFNEKVAALWIGVERARP